MTQLLTKAYADPFPPDYFLSRTPAFGGLQPHGMWWNLAELFAISNGSPVDPGAFVRLASGRSPDGVRRLADVSPRDGVELTFRADASVAALWASLDCERRAIVEQCQIEAVAHSLQLVEWRECAYQEPLYERFLPTPADIIGALFQHAHADPVPDLHTHCFVLGIARARPSKAWGRLHRAGFGEVLTAGASVYQRTLMGLLRKRLAVSFEPYGYDELGARFRVTGTPLQWAMFCGDRRATNPAQRPLYGAF